MAILQIAKKDGSSESFDIADKAEVSIGRAKDNDVSLDDASASSHHCVITRSGQQYTLKDLGATNTTRLNNKRIEEERINAKDVIAVGSVMIMVTGDDIEEDASRTAKATQIIEVSNGTRKMPARTGTAFAKRKSYKGLWITVIIVVAVLALGAAGWFVLQLSQNAG